jgi:O-glycosyl hydrolase
MLLRAAAAVLAAVGGTTVAGEPSAGSVEVVESSEAGAHWKAMPPLHWETDEFAAEVAVTARLEQRKQMVMGFGSAMTDTSAYNAMVWMDDDTRSAFFEALWGKTGLGLSIGRVALNSADYSFQSFNCTMPALRPHLRISLH